PAGRCGAAADAGDAARGVTDPGAAARALVIGAARAAVGEGDVDTAWLGGPRAAAARTRAHPAAAGGPRPAVRPSGPSVTVFRVEDRCSSEHRSSTRKTWMAPARRAGRAGPGPRPAGPRRGVGGVRG